MGVDLDLHDVEVDIGPGDVLVFFTDGIVERHEGNRFFDDEGLAKVVRSVRGMPAPAIAVAIEQAARAFVDGEPRDDMAVVVLRVPRVPRPADTGDAMAGVGAESRTSFPCEPASAGKARRFVRSVLAELGPSELVRGWPSCW